MLPTALPIYLLVWVLGLAVGSFLNVVGLRLLREEEIVHEPSHCYHCNYVLTKMDNIPVLSWLMLGGACRECKTPISIQYPLVEMFTGFIFVVLFWQFGASFQTLFLMLMMANLIVIFITDLRESYIFLINSLSLIPLGLIYNFFNMGQIPGETLIEWGFMKFALPDIFISALLAVVIPFIFFEGLILLCKLFLKTEGFGHGDTHLMMGVGAFLGWPLMLLSLILGFVIQTIPSIPIMVYGWIQRKEYDTMGWGAAALVFAGIPFFALDLLPLGTSGIVSIVSLLASFVCLFFFMGSVKNRASHTYLPLGPALIVGSLVSLFWGPQLLAILGY